MVKEMEKDNFKYYIRKPVFDMHEVLLKVSRATNKEIYVAVRREQLHHGLSQGATIPYIIYKTNGAYFYRSILANSFIENLKELKVLEIILIPDRETDNETAKKWHQITKKEVDKDFIPLSLLLPNKADIMEKFYSKGHWGYLVEYERKL